MLVDYGVEFFCNVNNGLVPGCRNEFAPLVITNQRCAYALFVVHKRMTKAAFNAEELAVEPVYVAIARHDAHQFITA